MIVQSQSIDAATALRLVQDTFAEAGRNGWRIAAAVVDPQGVPLASARMDHVAPPILEFALDKAFTAATMRRTTEAFFSRMEESPALRMGLANRARLIVWGGGLPIVHGGQVVGGIGVSGAKDFEDIACAKAALAQAGLGWEV
jgi:uncharacterized protein GlcG (DUF336 family)